MQLRRLVAVQLLVAWIATVMVGCSSSYEEDLLRAEQLERAGNYAAALAAYEAALPKIPATYRRQVASARIHAGDCAMKLQRFKEAFEQYQKAVDGDPSILDAHLHLAELLVIGGLPRQALDHAQLVLEKQPENSAALSLLGSISAEAGNKEKAIEFFQHSLANDPGREGTVIALAELYNRIDKVAEARSVLQRSAINNPNSPSASLALGRLEEQEGNSKAAEGAYRQAVRASDSVLTNLRLAQFLERLGRVPEAEQVLRHADSLRPTEPTALADFQLAAGRPNSASSNYFQQLSQTSSGSQLPKRELAARLVEAELQRAGGDDERPTTSTDAMNHFMAVRSMLEKYRPALDDTTIAILDGEIALAEGNMEMAERAAATARYRSPNSAAAHYISGLVFQRQERVAEAKEEWIAALEADAAHVPARIALADQSLSDNDPSTADEQISSVVREEPGNIAALNVYARVLLAERQYDSARGIVNRATLLDPNGLDSQLILGNIETAEGHYGSALIVYQKALLAHPDSSNALNGLLNVYRKGNITRPILRQMERVADASPSSATLMEITGRLYEEHGWHTDAVRALRRAITINAERGSAALALTKAYYAEGEHVAAEQTIFSSHPLTAIAPTAASILAATKAGEQGDDLTAIRNYEEAIRVGESSGAAANNLAWIYAQQETKLDRALQLALLSVDRSPKDAARLDTLGVVYLKLRNYSFATDVLMRAASLSEHAKVSGNAPAKLQSDIYRHLAAAYSGAGLMQEADSALAKAR